MRRVSHSDSRSARSRRSQSGAHTEGRHAAPLLAPGTARWSAQEEASARALGSARRGARPAFRPQWVCGQPHPWPILGSRPQRKRKWGVLSVMLWLRLGVQTTVQGPAGQGWHLVCPPDPTLPLQTRAPLPSHLPPLTTGSLRQRQHCKMKRGAPSLENCQLPPPRSEELAPEQLEARPHLLNRIRAPSWSDTPAGTHHGALFTEAPAQLEGGLWPKAHTAQPANLGTTDPSRLHGRGWLAPALGRGD